MLFRGLLLVILTFTSLYAKNIYLVTDVSQKMNKEELNDLIKLSIPKDNKLYSNKDHFTGILLTEKKRKKIDALYVPKNKNKKKNSVFFKKYAQYIKMIKKTKSANTKKLQISSDIILLIDTSGSMKNLMNSVRDSLSYLIQHKGKVNRVAIITFDGHKKHKASKRSHLVQDFSLDRKELLHSLSKIKHSRYNTYLGAGLERSLNLMSSSSAERKIIYLVSDGDSINDTKLADAQIQRAKSNKVDVKVIAIGGASINLLKKYSTSGYVYNATQGDLNSVLSKVHKNHDKIFENLALLSKGPFKKNKGEDGILIINSTMMHVSDVTDFYIVPNLKSTRFLKETNERLSKESLEIDFHGLNVYIRLLGNPDASKENELNLFWKRFIDGHNGTLKHISKDALTSEDITG